MTMTMSMIFRSIAAVSRKFVQAMTPAAIIMSALVIYTGFAIPVKKMRGWSRWINYVDPIGYGFESLMINEFHNRRFDCAVFVPSGQGYSGLTGDQFICSVTGARPGETFIDGDEYLRANYTYTHAHKWRNVGILFGFCFFFLWFSLMATGELAPNVSIITNLRIDLRPEIQG